MKQWKYRSVSTTTLRASLAIFSKRPLCWLFADQIVAIEMELLARELEEIASVNDGYLVEWIVGAQ